MNVDVGVLNDGGVLMVFDTPPEDPVKRIELYRDQRLMMLVFDAPDRDGTLLNHELPETMISAIEQSPNIMIFSLDHTPPGDGYRVPLIKVGNVY